MSPVGRKKQQNSPAPAFPWAVTALNIDREKTNGKLMVFAVCQVGFQYQEYLPNFFIGSTFAG